MDYISFLFGVFVAIAIYPFVLKRYFTVTWKHKYHFSCPSEGCNFAISSNHDPDLIHKMGKSHMHSNHRVG